MIEDMGFIDVGDDDDFLFENQDYFEEIMFIIQIVLFENQCVIVSLGLYVVYDNILLWLVIFYFCCYQFGLY